MNDSGAVLAVIGGGRWGKTTLSVLASLPLPFDRVVAVTQFNTVAVQSCIDQLTPLVPFEVMSTLDSALEKYNIGAAIVVNAAQQHFQTALRLIERAVPVLIEKPVAQSEAQMKILIDRARKNQISIVPGLSYRFCSYLENYYQLAHQRGIPRTFHLQWIDLPNENRYGEVKNFDTSINVVQDVMSHVWTILSVVFKGTNLEINRVLAQAHDNHVVIDAVMNDIQGKIILNREGTFRRRSLSTEFDKGMLTLDFSIEPGTIFLDDRELSGDVDWCQKPGPLARQLSHFFSVISKKSSCEENFEYCMGSVVCSERAVVLKNNRHGMNGVLVSIKNI